MPASQYHYCESKSMCMRSLHTQHALNMHDKGEERSKMVSMKSNQQHKITAENHINKNFNYFIHVRSISKVQRE